MINSIPDIDPARRDKLIKVLDIDVNWRMHQVSDGQRRRVQICVGLLRAFKVRGAAGGHICRIGYLFENKWHQAVNNGEGG